MIKRLIKRLLMLARVAMHYDASPKVFFYHDVGTKYTPMGTDREMFWSHMKYLCDHPSASTSHFNCHEVAFDDGFRGIWDEREQFKAMGICPTVFIAIRLVGQPGYLTWDEIRSLQNDYGFRFECHTWSHQTLAGEMIDESPKAGRTDAWFHRELVESRQELERQLCCNVSALCFPAGHFSEDVIERCKSAGYANAYGSFPGNISVDYVQPRNLVQDFGLFDFMLALNGGMMVFRDRYCEMHFFG